MAFRADESTRTGMENVLRYLVPRFGEVSEDERARAREALYDIETKLGPVVDGYPSWHPLVRHHNDRSPVTRPGPECGYEGLDHTKYFAHGFITCPYTDGQEVIDSVEKLRFKHPAAEIAAERLGVKLYNASVTPILVKCEWVKPLNMDKTIPSSMAMALLLEKEVPAWAWAQVAETWDSMRPYFLGRPHGSRSSLFIGQESGQAMKKTWDALIHTGIFGPIYVAR